MTVLRRALGAILCVALLGASGCAPKAEPAERGSGATTPKFDNSETKLESAYAPPPAKISDPRAAVYSYLVWISYAYRTLNSSVASMTYDPWQEVRIDAYVEYNRQEKRAIDQRLMGLEVKGVDIARDSTATVSAHEEWKYRYIDLPRLRYTGKWLDASYETTYTLIRNASRKGWIVHQVDTVANGDVK